ncbi:MAG TPA: biotin--[acetyl-CoA-carboxylase] ligase [Nitrospirales bacterium]
MTATASLSHESIRHRLTTRTIGTQLVVESKVDSTNRAAMALSASGAAHGTVVVAEMQTQGRGRLGRAWISPPGVNLYFSILLQRRAALPSLTWLPLFAGLAVVRGVENLSGLACRLKWPNDVIIDRSHAALKLAGVLAEASEGSVVIGIGVNVNMAAEVFPPELHGIATSILVETGRSVDRGELLARILGEVEALYDITGRSLDENMSAYRKACSTIGKDVKVSIVGGQEFEGSAEAVASNGALCLRKSDGALLEIWAGDVVHLR